jgi:outer membrane lipoprotein carrier protein
MRSIFCLVLLLGAAMAGDARTELESVIARYQRVNTVTGKFEQSICSEEQGTCEDFAGKFFLARPDRFRFDISEPFEQVLVGDSTDLWVYFPESSMARHAPGMPNPFFEILLNSSTDEFRAESLLTEHDTTRLTLLPADSLASFQRIALLLKDDHSIIRIEMDDGLGNETKYSLSDVKYNARITENTLKFTPPEGTRIEE